MLDLVAVAKGADLGCCVVGDSVVASMKGLAHFWGKHERIKHAYSSYVGYWAFSAAAFTYLYDIDDSGYRDELVYPKDLVDYARKSPPPAAKVAGGA